MSDTLDLPPINAIKEIVDVLADMGIDPLHLNADGRKPTDGRHDIRLWLRYRTEFEAVCERLRLKPAERPFRQHGQREWFAVGDNDDRHLLVQCVSFEHHHDWISREASA